MATNPNAGKRQPEPFVVLSGFCAPDQGDVYPGQVVELDPIYAATQEAIFRIRPASKAEVSVAEKNGGWIPELRGKPENKATTVQLEQQLQAQQKQHARELADLRAEFEKKLAENEAKAKK